MSVQDLGASSLSDDLLYFDSCDNEYTEERKNKIDAIFEEEYNKIKKESDEYIAYLESRKGEMVAYVPSTSRVSPRSAYYTGTSNKGGTREDAKKDAEKIKEEKEAAKQ